MITVPNRVDQLREALERGQSLDTRKLARLQMLDLVVAGRQFMEEAVLHQEAEDERIQAELSGWRRNSTER